jgi:hypothetical protein
MQRRKDFPYVPLVARTHDHLQLYVTGLASPGWNGPYGTDLGLQSYSREVSKIFRVKKWSLVVMRFSLIVTTFSKTSTA